MRGDGATGEDNQAVRVLDEIGDNAARLGEALGGPVRGAVRIDVADGAGLGIGDMTFISAPAPCRVSFR